jgi:hypothetical protein
MRIFTWEDRREPSSPRAILQRGECTKNQCGQFSLTVSDGVKGMTARFDSRQEFEEFMQLGEMEESWPDTS